MARNSNASDYTTHISSQKRLYCLLVLFEPSGEMAPSFSGVNVVAVIAGNAIHHAWSGKGEYER